MSSRISRRTLAAELRRELAGARAFQVFLRRLGPNDVVYASALAFDQNGNVVEVKASADALDDALLQLLSNLDIATAPEGT